ncbi:P-loop containing nucleoside triphosphate hydrolase protein [Syncephalis plumigaleata]|nr:P-loop containing nucleoside triphosphate hydrolase protein [Syncephalis plumigaleata]
MVVMANNEKSNARKKQPRKKGPAVKRARTSTVDNEVDSDEFVSLSGLPWKSVSAPSGMIYGDDDLGGFLCLEEIEDVDCVWEGDASTGKVCRFKRRSDKHKNKDAVSTNEKLLEQQEMPLTEEEMQGFIHIDDFVEEDEVPEDKPKKAKKEKKEKKQAKDNKQKNTTTNETVKPAANTKAKSTSNGASVWESLGLVSSLVEALNNLGYTQPTRIQAETLPLALDKQDIIGAAETGSGKTLAFGLPILQYLAKLPDLDNRESRGLTALILAPTRELAIQVKDHLVAVSQHMSVKVAAIVGGMSVQKQERILKQHPDILVATPGRLWEIMSENDDYRAHIRRLRFLVLDEADRMLESGHFKELEFILSAISRKEKTSEWTEMDVASFGNEDNKQKKAPRRQTFVFSATLGHDLQLHKRKENKSGKKGAAKSDDANLQNLLDRIEFNYGEPKVVDVTRAEAVAENLVEARIDCLKDDKDLYLYYFLCRYPGRTIVFTNSIDCLRRILPLFKLLRIDAYGLHAQMQQRQRLKNVDRFKANERGVLIASDVAARGLDIPSVDHVIHYQLPRSGDTYVHRSGRTARAGKEGMSIMLCSPDELASYRKLCQVLKKSNGISEFPVDQTIVVELKKRIQLAKQIDQKEHSTQKKRHEDDWMVRNAEALGIELDDVIHGTGKNKRNKYGGDDSDEDNDERARQKAKVQQMKHNLNQLLSKPLMPHGSSGRYLTSGVVRDLADRLLNAKRKLLLTHIWCCMIRLIRVL